MKRLNVFVPTFEKDYEAMWAAYGHNIVHSIGSADVIQFTGGEDVSPHLYGHHHHPRTYSSRLRDDREREIYCKARLQGKQFVGICRGGQFLNVLNGGSMIQHVEKHARYGTHELVDIYTGEKHQVTSTHHQMMVKGDGGELVAVAHLGGAKDMLVDGKFITLLDGDDGYSNEDTEVVWYPNTRSLCFQPHPEYTGYKDCTDYFFSLVERYLA